MTKDKRRFIETWWMILGSYLNHSNMLLYVNVNFVLAHRSQTIVCLYIIVTKKMLGLDQWFSTDMP